MRLITSTLVVVSICCLTRAAPPTAESFACGPAQPAPAPAPPAKLIVHEWGTFTSLQDETGRSIGGLNSSVEPLPRFVHGLRAGLIINGGGDAIDFSKSIPRAHPDVTMRLETPVIYFHPAPPGPGNAATPITLDVTATLKGGLLSEFYPSARFHIEGGSPAPAGIDHITAKTRGSLTWKGLTVGGDVKLPATKEHVWLAPRAVDSARVSIHGEGEQYVFYRGVGNIEAPMRITRFGDKIAIVGTNPQLDDAKWGPLWLAEFRADGTCAFRTINQTPKASNDRNVGIPATFAEADFSRQATAALRGEMRAALISQGLFDDEADAMLNTWERSYFQGPGQRLFFLVPRQWTDATLPLSISVPTQLTRVMMGRIELVTAPQRAAIQKLAEASPPSGKAALALYESLGRFGNALVLDELRQRPSAALAKFAKANGIVAFTPAPTPATPAAAAPATQPVAGDRATKAVSLSRVVPPRGTIAQAQH
jgi:hypothetical protein